MLVFATNLQQIEEIRTARADLDQVLIFRKTGIRNLRHLEFLGALWSRYFSATDAHN